MSGGSQQLRVRDPFRNPEYNDDEDEQHQQHEQNVRARAPTQASHPMKGTPLRHIFTTALPDPYSRMIFIAAFLAILVCSGLWLSWILETRWLQQQRHPTVVVSQEIEDHIPPFHAVGFQFPDYLFDMPAIKDQMYPGMNYSATHPPNNAGHYIAIDFSSIYVNSSYTGPAGVLCENVQPRNKSFICQPTQHGQKVFGSDPSTPLPDTFDPEVWDWQVTSVSDQLNFQIWTFLNVSAVLETYGQKQFPFVVPSLTSYLAGPQSVVGVNKWFQGSRSVEELNAVIRTLPGVYNYEFNKMHATALSVTKRIPLSGATQISFQIANRDVIGLTTEQVDSSFDAFTALFPTAAPDLDVYRKIPGCQMFYMQYALRIADMNIIKSTEVNQYGILPFLSDLGGFLSMIFLAIGILFPIVAKVTEPRRFLGFILLNKLHITGHHGPHMDQTHPGATAADGASEMTTRKSTVTGGSSGKTRNNGHTRDASHSNAAPAIPESDVQVAMAPITSSTQPINPAVPESDADLDEASHQL